METVHLSTEASASSSNMNSFVNLCIAASNGESKALINLIACLKSKMGGLSHTDKTTLRGLSSEILCKAASEGGSSIGDSIDTLIAHGIDPNMISFEGVLPLLHACEVGRVDVVKKLIFHGADVHSRDSYGSTALHVAARVGKLDVIDVLIENGANVDALCFGRGCNGGAPLHVAARHQQVGAITRLTFHGADINKRDSDGDTPLSILIDREGNYDTVLNKLITLGTELDSNVLDAAINEKRISDFLVNMHSQMKNIPCAGSQLSTEDHSDGPPARKIPRLESSELTANLNMAESLDLPGGGKALCFGPSSRVCRVEIDVSDTMVNLQCAPLSLQKSCSLKVRDVFAHLPPGNRGTFQAYVSELNLPGHPKLPEPLKEIISMPDSIAFKSHYNYIRCNMSI